jgi:PEP-CTERM motif
MSDQIAGWTATRLATVLWVIGAVLLGSSARAGSIQFAPAGPSGSTYTIGGIDPGPGSALAVGALPLTVGATFQLDYQASIPALIGTNGLDFTPPGLGSTYQLTVVGSFTEVVASSSGTEATFALAPTQSPNSFFELYYNPTVVANNLAGTGFNVGTLVLAGTPAPTLASVSVFSLSSPGGTLPSFDQFSNHYPGITSVGGSGSSLLSANITYENPAFVGTRISSIQFNSSLVTPFDEVSPSALFVGGPGTSAPSVTANIGTINGVSGPDFQFQADANLSFTAAGAIPEPSSVILASLGLLGAFCFAACMRK